MVRSPNHWCASSCAASPRPLSSGSPLGAVQDQVGLGRGRDVFHAAVGEVGNDRLAVLGPGIVHAQHLGVDLDHRGGFAEGPPSGGHGVGRHPVVHRAAPPLVAQHGERADDHRVEIGRGGLLLDPVPDPGPAAGCGRHADQSSRWTAPTSRSRPSPGIPRWPCRWGSRRSAPSSGSRSPRPGSRPRGSAARNTGPRSGTPV